MPIHVVMCTGMFNEGNPVPVPYFYKSNGEALEDEAQQDAPPKGAHMSRWVAQKVYTKTVLDMMLRTRYAEK
jgi:hypothetical protein